MSPIPEAPISIFASALLNNITIKLLVAITTIPVIAVIIHYASPQRLTDILLADMAKAKKTYLEAHAADTTGISASEMEKLHNLQRKVSAIHVETLHNSRSNWKTFRGFCKGRTLTVLGCIWKVRDLETHIKIWVATDIERIQNNLTRRATASPDTFHLSARAASVRGGDGINKNYRNVDTRMDTI
ncbi:hypothetical protein B0H13DRAFT_2270256 [Mycena leptocephala]|nr:hypothetical protein B0H13DRAFT_2270256 [Mycena leptocephala]